MSTRGADAPRVPLEPFTPGFRLTTRAARRRWRAGRWVDEESETRAVERDAAAAVAPPPPRRAPRLRGPALSPSVTALVLA